MAEPKARSHRQKTQTQIQIKSVNELNSGSITQPSIREPARAASLPLSAAAARRSRFQRQLEAHDPGTGGEIQFQEKGTITPAMRKKYLKDLFLNNSSHRGLSTILSLTSSSSSSDASRDCGGDAALQGADDSNAFWVLDPTEHAWMLSAIDGRYDTMAEFLSEDPSLLSRKDFVSGYTALHWLAKMGNHETLLKLLKDAERKGYKVDVNLKGSGGLTPLHVAALHSQYMVVKILVGAFSASVDVMDYNGKRAWQYLKENAPEEMKELLGAWDEEHGTWQLNVNSNNNNAAACTEGATEAPTMDHQTDPHCTESVHTNRPWHLGPLRKLLAPFFTRAKN